MEFLNLAATFVEIGFIGLGCVLPIARAWNRTARKPAAVSIPTISVPALPDTALESVPERTSDRRLEEREAIVVPTPPVLAISPPAHLRVLPSPAPSRLEQLRAKYGQVLPPVIQVAPDLTPEDVEESIQVIPVSLVEEVAAMLASLPDKQKPHPLIVMAA